MTRIEFVVGRPQASRPSRPSWSAAMDDDDSYFLVGGLRCKARANWNITIGVRQLSKAVQKTVKMRADEDREQAVRHPPGLP